MTLLAVILGERLMGISGMILAPVVLHFLKTETSAIEVKKPGQAEAENTRPLGKFLRDIMCENMTNFRVFGPDENTSNKLEAI